MDILRRYITVAIIFALITAAFSIVVFMPPAQNPPIGPIEVGAGPRDEAIIRNTEVTINYPKQTIDVKVTLGINQTGRYFIYVLLPYTISSRSYYGIYEYQYYPLSIYPPQQTWINNEIGNFSIAEKDTTNSTMLNIALTLNPDFNFDYLYSPDTTSNITIGITMKISDSLFAVDDSLGGKKTGIFTFFGDVTGIWTSDMNNLFGPSGQASLNAPFTVSIALPNSYYYSNSHPAPIDYYVKQDNRWITIPMDFLDGKYAQTLVCNMENPQYESLRELLIFLIGVSSTLCITFATEAWLKEKGNDEGSKKSSSGYWHRLPSIKKMIVIVIMASFFAIMGFLIVAFIEKSNSIYYEFIAGFVAGLLGILLGFTMDRAVDHDNDNQTRVDFLKLLHDELIETKDKSVLNTQKVELLYTDVWDSIVSSGVIRLFNAEQVTKISKVYKAIKNYSSRAELTNHQFQLLENIPEKQKTAAQLMGQTRAELELDIINDKKKLVKEIEVLLKEPWW